MKRKQTRTQNKMKIINNTFIKDAISKLENQSTHISLCLYEVEMIDQLVPFFNALGSNHTLKSLHILHVPISVNEIDALADALTKNTSLKSLWFMYNHLGLGWQGQKDAKGWPKH